MPQLDKVTIFNQIFFTIILFAIFYILITSLVLVTIRRTMLLREMLFKILSNIIKTPSMNSQKLLSKAFKIKFLKVESISPLSVAKNFSIKEECPKAIIKKIKGLL